VYFVPFCGYSLILIFQLPFGSRVSDAKIILLGVSLRRKAGRRAHHRNRAAAFSRVTKTRIEQSSLCALPATFGNGACEYDSPDKYKYARVEVMSFGFWNCANALIEREEYDGTHEEQFKKLFKRTRTIACDEP